MNEIRLKEILFRQIGEGYSPQYSRPFEVSGKAQDINNAVDAITTSWIDGSVANNANGARYNTIGAELISGAAGQLIAPSAETHSANIGLRGSGAWGDDRFIFWAIFETEEELQVGYFHRYVVSGYTESDDGLGFAPINETLDPRMKMFVNSVQKLQIQMVPDGYGGFVERCTVQNHDEVHTSNTSDYDLNNNPRLKEHLCRPIDILDMCQIMDSQGTMSPYTQSDSQYSIGSSTHIAGFNRLGYGPKKLVLARTDNLSSPSLVSNLLGGISASRGTLDRGRVAAEDYRHETDNTDYKVYANAKGTSWVRESSISNNGQAIIQLFRDRLHYNEHPYISYSEFLKVFPNAHPRYRECEVSMLPPYVYDDKSSDRMSGASKEQIEAFRIACSFSSIMHDNGFVQMGLIATNQTIDGRWDFRPIVSEGREIRNIRTTDTNVVNQFFKRFCDDLQVKVLIPATTMPGGYIQDMTLEIGADLMTDIRILISIGGGSYCKQVFPAFASASYSPLRYKNQQGENDMRIINTSAVVSRLADSIYETCDSRTYRDRDTTITGPRTRPSYSY